MRTIVYIDGYNLYFCLLRDNKKTRWLNIEKFIRDQLDDNADLIGINYYTARVKGKIDPDAPRKQQQYLNALDTLPLVKIHYGKFLINEKWAGFVLPPEFRPEATASFTFPDTTISEPYPAVVKVIKAEEKGSDVALGAHLVQDAYTDKFDQAVILTNDTDLLEPMRIVKEDVGKPVGLLVPTNYPAKSLKDMATWYRHLKESDALKSQFSINVVATNGKVAKCPQEWQ